MSVDKFGRHSTSSKFKPIRGPPGEGFHFTNDGNYNIQNKRLCNVAEPKLSSDAVNRSHLDKRLTINSANSLSFNGFRLSNAGQPTDENDVTTVQYMKDNVLVLNNDEFDASNHFIRRLKFPEQQSDAANKIYVDQKLPFLKREGCDFQDTRLINVKDPVDNKDAVNKQAMIKTVKQYKQDLERYCDGKIHYSKSKQGLDLKKIKLTNIGKAINNTDAVSKEFLLHELQLNKKELENDWSKKFNFIKTQDGVDFLNQKLHNIGRPVQENDAVSVKYLLDMLNMVDERVTNMAYNMYIDLAKDNPVKNKDEFITKYKIMGD